jgi:sensor histidine kinase YesM
MLKRLNDLICEIERTEKEKQQYKIQMLQSQIRPHFLYNTLACISSLAKQNRIREIRTTISAVISLLAYTFDKTDDFVRIQEEIEALDMYVRIQKIRYGIHSIWCFRLIPRR